MHITRISTEHLRIPLSNRGRISLSDRRVGPDVIDLILVQADTDDELSGVGFTYVLGPGACSIRDLLDSDLAPLAIDEDPRDTDRLFAKAQARFRSVGFAGLAARAYAAVDIALWDLKAKAASLPLYRYLGNARPSAPYFVSDIALAGRDASEAIEAALPLMKQGAIGVRVEVGGGDMQADADRVREIQEGLGDEAWLGVTARGTLDLATAQALAHFFEDLGIDWFEDPIPYSDSPGFARLAGAMEVPLVVGADFDTCESFYRVIRDGVIRIVRPDICRLGGITPLLKIVAAAEAFHVAVAPVRMPEIGVHLACGLGAIANVDKVGWFQDIFSGSPTIADGKLKPSEAPGLGLTPNGEAVAKFRMQPAKIS